MRTVLEFTVPLVRWLRWQDGLLQDGLLRDGLLQDGLLRDGLLRDGLLRDGLLRQRVQHSLHESYVDFQLIHALALDHQVRIVAI
jgi:hypothetical protein